MDKYKQIAKLAEAHALILEVATVCDPDYSDMLQDLLDHLAWLGDEIENFMEEE